MRLNKINIASLFLGILITTELASAGVHEGLISCKDWHDLHKECVVAKKNLEKKQSVHSSFLINYSFTCDNGGTPGRPSPIKLGVTKDDGKMETLTLNYVGAKSKSIDGIGPVTIFDSNPKELGSLTFKNGCSLRVDIEIQKSSRTIAEEESFFEKIESFVKNSPKKINEFSELQVQYKADFFAAEKDSLSLACTIENHEGDPLYDEIIDNLKANYKLTFGENYTTDSCKNEEIALELVNDCSNDDVSRSCVYKRAYFSVKGKLEKMADEINRYLNDPKTKSFHQRLKELVKLIEAVDE